MTRAANPELPEKIMQKAEDIITTRGHEALNMRSLARDTGVTATTIYHYFENKEDLLHQLRLRFAERLNASIRQIEDDPDPSRVLTNLGWRYIEFAERYPKIYRFLFETTLIKSELTLKDTSVFYYTYYVARSALERIKKAEKLYIDPAHGALMGWTMLHGFCSLLLAGTLQPAEQIDNKQLKQIFMSYYAHNHSD